MPKIPQMKYTVYLFDFDYTLADSSRGIVTCFRSVLERHGYTGITDDMIKRTIGKTLEESFSILTGITDADQLESFRQEYSKEADIYMNANTILFPDTLPTLTHLKKQGIRIGIISTKYRFRILSFLRNHMPDDWFDIIIGGEDVTHHKPDPEGLLLAIDRLKACPEEVLYIGDRNSRRCRSFFYRCYQRYDYCPRVSGLSLRQNHQYSWPANLRSGRQIRLSTLNNPTG